MGSSSGSATGDSVTIYDDSYVDETAITMNRSSDGWVRLQIQVADQSNNWTNLDTTNADPLRTIYIQLDRTAPSFPLGAVSIADTSTSSTAATDGPVTVNVSSITETGSGIASRQYRIGASGSWTAFTDSLTFTANLASASDGNVTIYTRATDNAGNTTTSFGSDTILLDKTAPAIGTVTITDTSSSSAALTNGPVTVTVTFITETGSGIASREYQIGSGSWNTFTGLSFETNLAAVASDGNVQINVRATDNVGNVTASANYKYDQITLDKTPPVVNGSIVITLTDTDGGSTLYTSGEVIASYTVTITDTNGIANKAWCLKGLEGSEEEWKSFSGTSFPATVNATNNGIYIRATDTAGNTTSALANYGSATIT